MFPWDVVILSPEIFGALKLPCHLLIKLSRIIGNESNDIVPNQNFPLFSIHENIDVRLMHSQSMTWPRSGMERSRFEAIG